MKWDDVTKRRMVNRYGSHISVKYSIKSPMVDLCADYEDGRKIATVNPASVITLHPIYWTMIRRKMEGVKKYWIDDKIIFGV